ncbi:MAG: hypothetical protein E6R03_10620 [Hyphomicrobiaceae bacterium]|nr:MAG: hypothetical protein E6R03_10620 [Hyphomicrobiaceae bacterium]
MPNWIIAIPTFILTALVAFALHTLDVSSIEKRNAKEIEDVKVSLTAQCEQDKQLTSEVSDEYQSQISNLNDQLAKLKRLRRQAPDCVPVASQADSGHADTERAELTGKNGLRSEWLLDYAAEAEQYRLQLKSCQDFINKVWDMNGQTGLSPKAKGK